MKKEKISRLLYEYICNYKYSSDIEVIDFFLNNGADINYKDECGDNCLCGLYWHFNDFTVLNYLLEKGINYEEFLSDLDYIHDDRPFFIYLRKYHEAKLLKEKLDDNKEIVKRKKI